MPTNVFVKALLDRQSPRSLAMLGIVVEDPSSNTLHTEGIVGDQGGNLDPQELADLVAGGHATKVNGPSLSFDGNLAALWIGDEFASESDKLGLKLPPLPQTTSAKTDAGRYWVASTQHVWRVLDSWIIQAFRHVVAKREERLATLMRWASADRDETRAALWLTMNKTERARELRWWVRTGADRGDSTATPEILIDRYQKLIKRAEIPASSVVGFCAAAKGGDNDVAQFFATSRHIKHLSFGDWLKKRVVAEGYKANRPLLQQRGQEIINRFGALTFCLDVLEGVQSHIPEEAFVIDGIRHVAVLDSIQALVGADRFKFAFVDRSAKKRRDLLIQQEHLSPDLADRVMNDITEREVPMLKKLANIELSGEREVKLEGQRLLNLVPA